MTDRITPEERVRRVLFRMRGRDVSPQEAADEFVRMIRDAEADVYAQLYAALVDRPTIVTQVVMKVLLAIGGRR